MSFSIDAFHNVMELVAPSQGETEEIRQTREGDGRWEMLMIQVFPSAPPWKTEKSPKMGTFWGRSSSLHLSRL